MDSTPPSSTTQASKASIDQGIVLVNQSTIFKQMIAMHPRSNEPDHCTYLHRICMQPRLDGYTLCNRHILYDKNAPFKQCSFQHPQSQRRCSNSVRKLDRHESKIFCDEHVNYKPVGKGIENFKQQFLISDHQSNPSNNASLTSLQKSRVQYQKLKRKFELLEHYCPSESHSRHNPKRDWEINPEDKTIIMHRSFEEKKLEAFCQVLYGDRRTFPDPMKLQVNQITTSDDFEQDTMAWLNNDPLRYAGYLSIGDIENSLSEKFAKIKKLQLLLAKTRPEIQNLQSELRTLRNLEKTGSASSSTFQVSQSTSELGNCKNKAESDSSSLKVPIIVYGTENNQKDVETGGLLETVNERYERLNPPKVTNVCVYRKDQEKCSAQVLPLSRYCQKHILYDISQCLFRPCGASLPDQESGSCLEPIVPYISKRTCMEHVTLK